MEWNTVRSGSLGKHRLGDAYTGGSPHRAVSRAALQQSRFKALWPVHSRPAFWPAAVVAPTLRSAQGVGCSRKLGNKSLFPTRPDFRVIRRDFPMISLSTRINISGGR
jgi:hypothetical protein